MVKVQGLIWHSEDASLLGPAINHARYHEVLRLVHQGCVMRLRNLLASLRREVAVKPVLTHKQNSSTTTISFDLSTPLET